MKSNIDTIGFMGMDSLEKISAVRDFFPQSGEWHFSRKSKWQERVIGLSAFERRPYMKHFKLAPENCTGHEFVVGHIVRVCKHCGHEEAIS